MELQAADEDDDNVFDTLGASLPDVETRIVQGMLYRKLMENKLTNDIMEMYKDYLDMDIKIVCCKQHAADWLKQIDMFGELEEKKVNIAVGFVENGCCICDIDNCETVKLYSHRLSHLVSRRSELLPILIFLFSLGCDMEAVSVSEKLYTPLLTAISCNTIATVQYLISVGVNVNSVSKDITSPILLAIYLEHAAIAEQLLATRNVDVNIRDEHNQMLLIKCLQQHKEFVPMLLKAGADPNVTGNFEDTALMYAINIRDIELIKMLIKYGADVNLKNRRNEMALTLCIYREDVEVARILLDAGADPNSETNDSFPLLLATYDGHLSVIQLLIKYGCNVRQANSLGYTALHIAAWNGHESCVKEFLKAQALHDTQAADKNTPLALAAHGNHLNVIEILLPYGCNVNNADKDLDTPLHYAAYNGMVKAVEMLIKYGANPNCYNRVDATPLWNAVYCGKKEVVKLLLKSNVELERPSVGINQHAHSDHAIFIYNSPRPPLWVAVKNNYAEIALLLVTAGYKLYSEDWLINHNFPLNCHDKRLKDILIHYVHNPPKLISICRNFFRQYFGLNIKAAVDILDIPGNLKHYLTIADLTYSIGVETTDVSTEDEFFPDSN